MALPKNCADFISCKQGRMEPGLSSSASGCVKFGPTDGPNDKGTSYFCLIISFEAPWGNIFLRE